MTIHVDRPSRSSRWWALVFQLFPIALCAQVASGGMELPDTLKLPETTYEIWNGLPHGYDLPAKVDLSKWLPPAGNQGRQWSCVPWALCYGAMTYRWNLRDGRTYSWNDPVDSAHTFSPAYLYNIIAGEDRMIDAPPVDSVCKSPMYTDNVLDFAMFGGCCTLKDMNYDSSLSSCCTKPGYRTMLKAFPNHTPPALMLNKYDPEQWRYHLSLGQPIITSINVDTVFRDGGFATGGDRMFTWSFEPQGRLLFGHAVICTGYEDDSTFIFMNSWGQHWGYHGYFKATLERLEYFCSGAYVLPNDTAATWTKVAGTPADKDTLNGPVVNESFEEGEFQVINGKKVKLESLDHGDRDAVMQVFSSDDDTRIRTIPMHAGHHYAVYANGERIELIYARRSTVARLFGLPVHFTMRTSKATEDAYLRERNALIRRLRKEMSR